MFTLTAPALLMLLSSQAMAIPDPPEAELTPCAEIDMYVQPVAIEGMDGIWFNTPLAVCILNDLQEYALLQDRVVLLEQSLRLASAEADAMHGANSELELTIGALEEISGIQTKQIKRVKRRGKIAMALGVGGGIGIGLLVGFLVAQ